MLHTASLYPEFNVLERMSICAKAERFAVTIRHIIYTDLDYCTLVTTSPMRRLGLKFDSYIHRDGPDAPIKNI